MANHSDFREGEFGARFVNEYLDNVAPRIPSSHLKRFQATAIANLEQAKGQQGLSAAVDRIDSMAPTMTDGQLMRCWNNLIGRLETLTDSAEADSLGLHLSEIGRHLNNEAAINAGEQLIQLCAKTRLMWIHNGCSVALGIHPEKELPLMARLTPSQRQFLKGMVLHYMKQEGPVLLSLIHI